MFGQRKIGAIDGLMVGYVDGYLLLYNNNNSGPRARAFPRFCLMNPSHSILDSAPPG